MAETMITKEAAIEAVKDAFEYPEYYELAIELAVEAIKKMPEIDAKPVVHAHWEKGCHCEYIAIPWWTCSHCGKGALTREETIYDQVLTDYCPYCGATMDEVTE